MMSSEVPFRLATFLIIAASLSISIYFRARAEREGGRLDDPRGLKLVRVLRLFGLAVVAPLLAYLINPSWVAWARFFLPDWARWLAAAVAAGMVPVFYWIFISIGRNISPTATARHGAQLVTHGPYRWVRHPLYTAGTIVWLALMAVTTLWWLAFAIPALVVLLWRTSKEEAKLIEAFGDAYRAYMQRTGRFLPKLLGSDKPSRGAA
jgi:protein-S-isoprenylcysteine O-methyltransferase Ste14